ncbi:helix-turn-helix domain-containing protein [Tengunoibacter tsumagoiensis]|uniref:HTH cro/C1-type domain-containing protein n=1 Tax=Tengunoibacter tsumagoiensis TaxID=2014871 RepID=A0A402A4M3_9CHLR|nr:helix-turn-helix transcriptional regulator [Tengunoibacter tsumagoiensis]GCE13955.1 hypothetical protein KTT_38140 [Tengunoibacter tsumagoiensis]
MTTPNNRLEAARLQRRWSVEVASSKIGVSVNTYNRWERGLQVPQLETLDLLCRAFAMSPEELGFAHAISAKRRTSRRSPHKVHPMTEMVTSLPDLPAELLYHEQTTFVEAEVFEQTKRNLEHINVPQLLENEEISRKQAIALLISAPAAVLSVSQGSAMTILHPEESLALSSVNLPLCWQLYTEGGLLELAQVLPSYLAHLLQLAQQSSPYQAKAAALASQTLQLSALCSLHKLDFGTSLKQLQDACSYASLADNTNLLLATTLRLAELFLYLQRSQQSLTTYEEALHVSSHCTPLLQGSLFVQLAVVYAHYGEEEVALKYLELARQTFPQQPEEDSSFPFTQFHHTNLHLHEARVYLHLQQPQQASQALLRTDEASIMYQTPIYAEILLLKARIMLALEECDQTCRLLAEAVDAALHLGSHFYYQIASTLYNQAQLRWRHEKCIQAISELFDQEFPG